MSKQMKCLTFIMCMMSLTLISTATFAATVKLDLPPPISASDFKKQVNTLSKASQDKMMQDGAASPFAPKKPDTKGPTLAPSKTPDATVQPLPQASDATQASVSAPNPDETPQAYTGFAAPATTNGTQNTNTTTNSGSNTGWNIKY